MERNDFTGILYHDLPQMVIGFHGCDESVALKIVNSTKEHIHPSTKNFDWLGSGAYFWLNDPLRAYEWAQLSMERGNAEIKNPCVVGAVIDLGRCLNLCERSSIQILQEGYDRLDYEFAQNNCDISEELENYIPDKAGFNLKRPLDCAVIQKVNELYDEAGTPFDTVYGYFQEGQPAYPGSDIREKSHIQICVRNMDCIKGYFLPRCNIRPE